MHVTLQRWGPDDLPVLERANTPEMTAHLGGPETDEQVRQRHERYLRQWDTGEARMFRIDVDDEPAGGIGWWQVEHDGVPAYETGWSVFPEWQGKGVARAALRAAHPPGGRRRATATCWSPTRASTTRRRTRCAGAPASSTPARPPHRGAAGS